MKQSCETGSEVRKGFRLWRTSVSFGALLFLILPWSWSNATPREPDLRVDSLFPLEHPFAHCSQSLFLFDRSADLVFSKSPDPIVVSPDLPRATMRIPLSASLQTGYVHSFQPDKHSGRVALDGLALVPLTRRMALFGEMHVELESVRFADPDWLQKRSDWSGGLGVRGLTGKNVLLGANCFFDESRLGGRPHKSGGLGFEMAAKISDVPREVVDLAVNLHRGGGIDARAGISFPLHKDVDLRVGLGKYRFYDGDYLLGWTAGTDVSVCGELLNFSYEFDQDRDRSACHTIGASLCAKLNLEDLFSGSWPFEWPKKQSHHEDRFASRMSHRVKRNWHQPDSFVRFAGNSQAMWNAPGNVRFDPDKEFSPTKTVVQAFFCPPNIRDSVSKENRSADPSLSDRLSFLVIGAAASVTTGVLEYGYRSLFGPFETHHQPKP